MSSSLRSSQVLTCLVVLTPLNLCPFKLSRSISSQDVVSPEIRERAKISPHLRLRPPTQVVIRSAIPQDSEKVEGETPSKKSLQKRSISASERANAVVLVE